MPCDQPSGARAQASTHPQSGETDYWGRLKVPREDVLLLPDRLGLDRADVLSPGSFEVSVRRLLSKTSASVA